MTVGAPVRSQGPSLPAAVESRSTTPPAETHTLAGTLLLLLLAGLALFDRPLAVLSVPGVPLFPAEIVLGFCVVYLLSRRSPFTGVRSGNWMAPVLVVVWLLWGAAKLATSLQYSILDVVRDSALSYYALFALVVLGLSHHDSRFRPTNLVHLYGRFVPLLLAVAPVRLVGMSLFGDVGPTVPGSDVPLTNHRLGNLGVSIGMAVVFLATSGRRNRTTLVGVVSGLVMLLVIGTQNRGGMIAGLAAVLVALALWGRHVKLRVVWTVLLLIATVIVAWGVNLRIQTDNREISVDQLIENVRSVAGSDQARDGQLGDTVDFREDLWERVLEETEATGRLELGWGFGPNLGSDFLPDHSDRALRNPHNSHLTVLARLGLVGLGLWVALWASWLTRVFRRAHRSLRQVRPWMDRAGWLALLSGAGVVGVLVNAYVDPTLETPMVAVWLWSLFGFGVLAVCERRSADRTPQSTAPRRS